MGNQNIEGINVSLPLFLKYLWVVLLPGFMALALVCNSIDIIDDAWITFRYAYNFAYKGRTYAVE